MILIDTEIAAGIASQKLAFSASSFQPMSANVVLIPKNALTQYLIMLRVQNPVSIAPRLPSRGCRDPRVSGNDSSNALLE
jgi:hypothetical protein